MSDPLSPVEIEAVQNKPSILWKLDSNIWNNYSIRYNNEHLIVNPYFDPMRQAVELKTSISKI